MSKVTKWLFYGYANKKRKKRHKSNRYAFGNTLIPNIDSRYLLYNKIKFLCLGKGWMNKHPVKLICHMKIMQIKHIHEFTTFTNLHPPTIISGYLLTNDREVC